MKTNFKFIKYNKVWFAFSSLLILIGIVGMISSYIRYGNFMRFGIDFTGGTLMELKFDEEKGNMQEVIRGSIDSAVAPNTVSQITRTDQDTYLIHGKDLSAEQYDASIASIKENAGSFEEIRFTTIGPTIGATLKRKAALALGIAILAIVLYIAYAFRRVPKRVSPWRFGICAIIALIHDVFITVGIFALFGFEIDALFITALLTILGFSVHDTIVVFDRIRENLKNQGRDDTFADITDASLNQTLSRSINTSFSTLITLFALFILGAESLKLFTLALIIGITIGTYSSMFIASPILALWQDSKRSR